MNREWSASSEEWTQIPIFLGSTLPDIDAIFSPHKYFSQFFDDDILDQIVQQSNFYFLQQDINKPLNLTTADLEKWLGLLLYFSISKLPITTMHWTKNIPLTDYASERYVNHSNVAGHHQDHLTLMQREDVAIL